MGPNRQALDWRPPFQLAGSAASILSALPVAYAACLSILGFDPISTLERAGIDSRWLYLGVGVSIGVGSMSLRNAVSHYLKIRHFAYIYRFVKIWCEFEDAYGRVPVKWCQRRRLQARKKGVNRARLTVAYGELPGGSGIKNVRCWQVSDAGLRDRELSVVPVRNYDLYETGQRFEVQFGQELSRRECIDFDVEVTLEAEPGRDAGSRFTYKVIHPTRHLEVLATYAAHDCPSQGTLKRIKSLGEGVVLEQRELDLDLHHSVVTMFDECEPGYVYGLSWEWEDKPSW